MILSKKIYWLLSLTWGGIMTLIGAIATLILMICGCKPQRNIYGWTTQIGTFWGGVDLGPFSIVNKSPSRHILRHEFGHSIQNCYWGILFPFVIAIPSAIRYWYRTFIEKFTKKELPPYDAIWFEGQATSYGEKYEKVQVI